MADITLHSLLSYHLVVFYNFCNANFDVSYQFLATILPIAMVMASVLTMEHVCAMIITMEVTAQVN